MSVFLSEYIHPEALALLKGKFQVVSTMDNPEEITAIILRVFEVNAPVMDKCKNLKLIAKHGVGCNTIDIDAAKQRGITVINTPSANTNSVAELIVGLMLGCASTPKAHLTEYHSRSQHDSGREIRENRPR